MSKEKESPDRQRLRRMRSDLHDLSNPVILKKYPHLDNQECRDQLKSEIARLTGKLK